MPTTTTTASPWPGRCAYISATIFIAASGITNVTYGWSKGDSLATSLVWAGIAGAVAIVLALSWPAMLRSLDQKRWGAALIALVALVLSGAYSVTAALGSAAGARANAAAIETATNDARAKAQAAHDTAKTDLEALATAKPVAERQALMDTIKAELGKLPASRSLAELEPMDRRSPGRDCGAENGTGRWVCLRPGPYAAELSRARQRERLEGKLASMMGEATKAEERLQAQRAAARAAIRRASEELARSQPARVANSDAVALATYLQAIGIGIDADRVNKLLVLLTVLIMECGGGLSLALGMALTGSAGRSGQTAKAMGVQTSSVEPRTALDASVDGHTTSVQTSRRPAALVQRQAEGHDLATWLRRKGGSVQTSMRRLARELGRSAAGVHIEVGRLVAAGVLTAAPSARGTVLTLAGRHCSV
jgi:hypothetical protein